MKRNVSAKSAVIFAIAMLVSSLPALAATVAYFPLWKASGDGSLLSGLGLLLLLLAAKPIYNHVKSVFSTPASYTLWFAVFVVFFALSKIADEVTVIAFVGFVSNLIGAVLFKLAKASAGKDGDSE